MVLWAVLLWLAGCGGEDSAGPGQVALHSEVVVEGETGAVRVDSVDWRPAAWSLTGSGELEIAGPYRLFFHNLTDQSLEIRYDLRFFDRDTFFIDVFIPFGLPLRLAPRQSREARGEFSIRTAELSHLEDLRTLRVTAAVQRAGETASP